MRNTDNHFSERNLQIHKTAKKTLEWPTIYDEMEKMTVLTIRTFLMFPGISTRDVPFSSLSVSLIKIRRPGAGVLSASETGIRAGCSLAGGFASLLEGSAHS